MNNTSSQRQFKTGIPQGGVLSPTLFNIYTADIPPPRAPVQVMAYADDITITSTHISTSAAKKYIQPCLHKVVAWTTFTLFTPDPAEYKSNMDLKNLQHRTTYGSAPIGDGPYLRPKTHIQHIHSQHSSTSTQATTNDNKHSQQQDGVNRRRHSWLPIRQS